jgi:hypothetical protein
MVPGERRMPLFAFMVLTRSRENHLRSCESVSAGTVMKLLAMPTPSDLVA